MKIQDLSNGTTLELNTISYDFIYEEIVFSMKIMPTEGVVYTKNDEHYKIINVNFNRTDESPQPLLTTLIQLSPLEFVNWLKAQYVIWINDDPITKLSSTHPTLKSLYQYIDSIGI